ncbi:MAG: efflux RND transporter periplasmic adaptor subunit [bacterium]
MNFKKIIIFIVVIGVLCSVWFGYKKFFVKPPEQPFKTQKLERRDIINTVQAEGTLEAQGTSKIGPLITGTIKKILVTENQDVKKGQLLALLDNGYGGNQGDSQVVQKKALLEQAKVTMNYSRSYYQRQEILYKAGQLAKDKFEEITRNYLSAKADLDNKQAAYEQELYQFEQTKIKAPHDGTILAIPVKEGELVSMFASTTTALFKIAKDLSNKKVILSVDEGKIGDLKIGQKVNLTVDTYPYRVWKGFIETIGKEPVANDAHDQSQKKSIFYKTELMIKDPELLLRPGMTVHAKIKVGKAKKVLALPGFVFQFSTKAIDAIAKMIRYTCTPLDAANKKELSKKSEHPHKFVWVVENKTLVEKAVEIGLSDNAYFEIKSGLTDQDDVLFDIIESDASKELMRKLMGGGL